MNYFFSALKMLGGLALFLYGMRLMSGSLKEGSSGTLKKVMEKVTNNPLKAFLLGLVVTMIIQSSTATIVITSGLVAAGIITLDQSLGVIVGANVGTTVTGQIIRLLDIDGSGGSILQLFKPSTLAPIALIIGIVLLMFFHFKRSDVIGNIAIGFGILFTGLLMMTEAVGSLPVGDLFVNLGDNPILGYFTGAGVAFALQSSSATIGILQAFSLSADIPFKTAYIVIVGIYLGDCLTTAIVCSIGAKADAKRVGLVNILFNLSETVLVLVVVTLLHRFGLLGDIWDKALRSGGIANTNTVFNLSCAVLLLPLVGIYGKISRKLIKDDPVTVNPNAALLDALNPVFFATPALAFRSSYEVLKSMLSTAHENYDRAISLFDHYDPEVRRKVETEEENIDMMADKVGSYLAGLSSHVSEEAHIEILDEYNKLVTEFERLGDHAMNIAEEAEHMADAGLTLSAAAKEELAIISDLLEQILSYTTDAFENRDEKIARKIEPLEEVVDDLTGAIHDNHLVRLRTGVCSVIAGTCYLNVLSNLERISDTCSNVGVAVIARVYPNVAKLSHSYISTLHQGGDESFNIEYKLAHDEYFLRLDALTASGERS